MPNIISANLYMGEWQKAYSEAEEYGYVVVRSYLNKQSDPVGAVP